MKRSVAILIVLLVIVGALKLYNYWEEVDRNEKWKIKQAEGDSTEVERLSGMPWYLEAKLREAQGRGPASMKQWIETYEKAKVVQDPRLAWIQLDYVLLVAPQDPVEAKRMFAEVKKRVPANSPVYPRIKKLEKTYDQ